MNIKTYCINFKGYILINAESEDEALQMFDEGMPHCDYDITEIEQMMEGDE